MTQELGPLPPLPAALNGLRVALAHDWLVSVRGGESVLASLCRMFPGAPIHTLVHDPAAMTGPVGRTIASHPIHTSFLQHIPKAKRTFRGLLPLFPHAMEAFDFRGFDLVISSSHCVAKGLIAPPSAWHISYIHTPMRYAYEQLPEYFGAPRMNVVMRGAVRYALHHLRLWDEVSANRVDHFVANSAHIAQRVHARYRRESTVVHPPVDAERFQPAQNRSGRFLMLGALAPYKRVDLAVEAFNRLKLPLDVVGTGQDERRLRAMAGPTVRFLGRVDDAQVAAAFAQARAFVFPGEEDFGITPLEAMASGTPVIAFNRGGATETVLDVDAAEHPTGVLFEPQTVDGLVSALERFLAHERLFAPERLRAHALAFSRQHFEQKLGRVLGALLREGQGPGLARRQGLSV